MQWSSTPLTEKLRIPYPLIQAPMAGGVTTAALVAAVSNAGGLGSLAAGYMEPMEIVATLTEIRGLTDKPFAVNLFVPENFTENADQIQRATSLLAPFRDELGMPAPRRPAAYLPNFNEQLSTLKDEGVGIVSFTFGVPSPEIMQNLRDWNIVTLGTATHVLEAIILEESGIDLIVAQGAEAGGHRGTFIGPPERGLVGTLALVPVLIQHVSTPVIAAGGIMDGRGIAAALALGAAGVQMGTAFLTCPESGAHAKYKEVLAEGTEVTTMLTRVFSGKLARSLNNRFITELQPHEKELPGYPIQNALTHGIRQAAARLGRAEFMSLWAGQGCPLCSPKPAQELVREWMEQVQAIFA